MNLSCVHYTAPTTVEVADVCPTCGADLRAPKALKCWVLIDLRRENLTGDETQDDHVDWADATWGNGGDLHQPLEWHCASCDACVCPSKDAAREADDANGVCDACGGSDVLFDTGLSQVERCDACAMY